MTKPEIAIEVCNHLIDIMRERDPDGKRTTYAKSIIAREILDLQNKLK